MRGKQDGQHTGRLLARGGVALLAAASIGFAAPAVATQPDTPSAHATQGLAHQPTAAHGTKHTGTHDTRHQSAGHQGGSTSSTSTSTGSAVSLDRPNGFQAQADPDGMANGGVDQPGGTGGVDTTSQDGNNGSGNDADCEDDNRGVGVPGHCKDRPGTGNEGNTDSGTPVPDQTADLTTDQTADLAPQLQLVPSLTPVADTGTASSVVLAPASDQVRARVRTPAAAHPSTGVLPETGAGAALLGLALTALVALGVGTGFVRRGRRTAHVIG